MPTIDHPLLTRSPYLGYVYAYPHKTAYRPFQQPLPLKDVWRDEPNQGRFLYVHIPFCEMRCGFCNLFTQARPEEGMVDEYLKALERQAIAGSEALGTSTFGRFAIGGGTPTYLDHAQLTRMFDIADRLLGPHQDQLPISVETSPTTSDWDKLKILRDRGVTRLSMGVQSFIESETSAAARPQQPAHIEQALERIRAVSFPILNIDLIYGLPEQSVASWMKSLRAALRYFPEELYLYPLYVRPLTSLGLSPRSWDDFRLDCYRAAREFLLEEGYEQISMRMFRARHAPVVDGPAYCCQDDGMLGLGCGARSYSRTVHSSTEYGVRQKRVRELIVEFTKRSVASFSTIDYGFVLDADEQRRRFLMQSILTRDGLSLRHYRQRFGSAAEDDFPQLAELFELELVEANGETISLTEMGLERSDAIGPWFYSDRVRSRMEDYEWQ